MRGNAGPPMMARDAGKAGAPDLARIAPPELRANPKALIEALGFRLFQTKLTPKESAVFLKFLDEQRGDEAIAAEGCEAMLSAGTIMIGENVYHIVTVCLVDQAL